MKHELKTDPDPFQAVWDRKKKFEIRYNDRDFQVGDTLLLKETEFSGQQMKGNPDTFPLRWTARKIEVVVEYIMHGPVYGLDFNWCIMSVMEVSRKP